MLGLGRAAGRDRVQRIEVLLLASATLPNSLRALQTPVRAMARDLAREVPQGAAVEQGVPMAVCGTRGRNAGELPPRGGCGTSASAAVSAASS